MKLRKRKGPTPAWWTLLNEAVRIITNERANIVQSYTDRIGPTKGKVTDYDARRWIREYDRFLKPARAELVKRHRA